VSVESIEPFVLVGIASAMLFPWRILTHRKCETCGVRRPRKSGCTICTQPEPA
jgi:hypothetical protein